MTPDQDPTQDIEKLFDEANFTGTAFLSGKKPMQSIVNEMRRQLAASLRSYIARRDHTMFNAGAESIKNRKIEVKKDD